MSQFSGFPQASIDYNSTIIGAVELSEKKWSLDRLDSVRGAGSRCAHKIASPPPTAAPALGRRILATIHARRRRSRRQDSAPPLTAATRVNRPRPQNPIARARPNSALPPRGFLLGRLSNAGPKSRPTLSEGAGVRNPRMRAAKSSAKCWSR
jgi:hypothetical protein